MIGSLGVPELLIIFFLIVLLFGAKKLPELAKGLGKGIKEFKNASKQVEDEVHDMSREEKEEKK